MRVGEFIQDPNRLGPTIGIAIGVAAVGGMIAWMASAPKEEAVTPGPIPVSAICVDAPVRTPRVVPELVWRKVSNKNRPLQSGF